MTGVNKIADRRIQALESERNELLKVIADTARQLDTWANQSQSGGWSTHQVEPMRKKAAELSLIVVRRR